MAFRKNATYSQRPNHAARAAHAKGERLFRNYDTTAIQPKRNPLHAVFAIAALVVVVAVVGYLVFTLVGLLNGGGSSLLAEGQEATVVVAEGEGAQAIGKSLAEAGLVGSAKAFTDVVNDRGAAASLKPGTYVLEGGMSLDDIVKRLVEGPVAARVTIPEGITLKAAAAMVEEATKGQITAADFTSAASDASVYAADYPFLADAGTNTLEGFLFPKTYDFTPTTTATDLVRAMLDQFKAETAGLSLAYAQSRGLSLYDVVKLAAIIEKESDDAHRATVASVFYNRLAEGMRLQSDATVAYFAGHDPTPADVATAHPYNTYTVDGLTPTPICSPGLEALKAACEPETTKYKYFYFAPDASGTMQYFFSETFEEHEATYS
ncbi:endolytic transglycosylase MltG [Berryella wangjianweii]|nr:endolytic transglycosylase MltG [Berryella wangjianweii]